MTAGKNVVAPLSGRARAARARLEQLGAGALQDAELLELLGIGPGVPALFELARLAPEVLVARLGRSAAITVQAAVELGRRSLRAQESRPQLQTPRDAYAYLEPDLVGRRRERFRVLCLNTRRILLADVLVAEGTPDSCLVDPREVYAPALSAGAQHIVLAHNHPSGDPEPSANDLELTSQLAEAGRLFRILVLDHLVIGAGRYVSMAQRGLCGLRPVRVPLAAAP